MQKTLLIILAVLLALLALGGYILLDRMFPLASPIQCPSEDEITSISVAQEQGAFASITASEIPQLLEYICSGEPTRQWSVQDYPTAENYYTVEIQTSGRMYRYFVYADGSQTYVESPYEGVYKVEPDVLDFLADCMKK